MQEEIYREIGEEEKMICPICDKDFFLGSCSHNTVDLILEIEQLKEEIETLNSRIPENIKRFWEANPIG